jgi:spore coat protein CotH
MRLIVRISLVISLFMLFSCKKDKPIDNPIVITPPTPTTGIKGEFMPLFVIKTTGTIVDEPKVKAEMKIYVKDSVVATENIGIEIRGAISQLLYEKKSYAFETWDATNTAVAKSVLGLPIESDWILYGPYGDKTLIKNVIAYQLSNNIGRYAAKTAFVEVEINGDNKGLYVLMEKLKRDKNRIDLKKLDAVDNDPTSITGGYILKIDKTAGKGSTTQVNYTATNSFKSLYDVNGVLTTNTKTYFLFDYPSDVAISTPQRQYITTYVQDFEKALALPNFKTDTEGYKKYIDVPSFIDFFLLNELMQNHDGYRLSTYLQKERGEKLKMGPIWDFDLTFGSQSFCMSINALDNYWVYQYTKYCPDDTWLVTFWWKRLLEDKSFSDQVKARWATLRTTQFSDATLTNLIDEKANFLTQTNAVKRNFTRWNILNTPVVPNTTTGTYDDEIKRMKTWITKRTAWIDTNIGKL